ncbi:hypothetical protein F4811DRAFT_557556 [Daldinia bambusicola]|nr:hypothetical protein F4811DRAFT_557556 [Daldinia bambusicola]
MRLVDEVNGTHTIDLARVRTECPLLVSTLQEVMRFYGSAASLRFIYEDIMLGDEYLLKKGGAVLMPNAMFHTDETLWGPSVGDVRPHAFPEGGPSQVQHKTPGCRLSGLRRRPCPMSGATSGEYRDAGPHGLGPCGCRCRSPVRRMTSSTDWFGSRQSNASANGVNLAAEDMHSTKS